MMATIHCLLQTHGKICSHLLCHTQCSSSLISKGCSLGLFILWVHMLMWPSPPFY